MAREKSPAFQFYPREFLHDERVQLMSHTERGIYITLLCLCWSEGTLPADPALLARMVHLPARRFLTIWEGLLRACFRPAGDGRIGHKRLDEERQKQESFRRRQSDNGRLGGRPRNPQESQEVKGLGNSGKALRSASSSASSSPDLSEEPASEQLPRITKKGDPPADAAQEALDGRAAALVDRYQVLYSQHRHGARLRLTANSLVFQDACDLVRHWDDARLEKLATIVLTTDDPFISGTDRSFRIFAMKASWADDRLAEVEAKRRHA